MYIKCALHTFKLCGSLGGLNPCVLPLRPVCSCMYLMCRFRLPAALKFHSRVATTTQMHGAAPGSAVLMELIARTGLRFTRLSTHPQSWPTASLTESNQESRGQSLPGGPRNCAVLHVPASMIRYLVGLPARRFDAERFQRLPSGFLWASRVEYPVPYTFELQSKSCCLC